MELVNRDDVSVVITCQGTGGGANRRRGWRRKAAPTRAGRWIGARLEALHDSGQAGVTGRRAGREEKRVRERLARI